MTKRRLTRRQLKQQKSIQTQRLERAQQPLELSSATATQLLGPEEPGLLIAHYGTTLIVESQTGQLIRCSLRQNLGTLVTGDHVIWQSMNASEGIVVACQPRRCVIIKPARHTTKPMVANVDSMLIIAALEPLPQATTLDRYIILAEILKLNAIIVLNKSDLPFDATHTPLKDRLKEYRRIGYKVLEASTKTHAGLAPLREILKNHTSILVGQSGVGKSSLLNSLVPSAQAQINELSKDERLGRHTTTASRLYHLPSGGDLIDSPGIHQFNLRHYSKSIVTNGFKEFAPFLGGCKFRNCAHQAEPDCALQTAVKNGDIALFRLQSYHIIVSDLLAYNA